MLDATDGQPKMATDLQRAGQGGGMTDHSQAGHCSSAGPRTGYMLRGQAHDGEALTDNASTF